MLNYTNTHTEGDTGMIPAPVNSTPESKPHHHVELYNPPASLGDGLKWRCSHCMHIFADPKHFEREPCIAWENR